MKKSKKPRITGKPNGRPTKYSPEIVEFAGQLAAKGKTDV
jgi:hypothetical protein